MAAESSADLRNALAAALRTCSERNVLKWMALILGMMHSRKRTPVFGQLSHLCAVPHASGSKRSSGARHSSASMAGEANAANVLNLEDSASRELMSSTPWNSSLPSAELFSMRRCAILY